ncbi:MAG: MFS transporter, partial [Bacteroidia bacterium]|nr:MFS transporter [Bacteroidia bacterium]
MEEAQLQGGIPGLNSGSVFFLAYALGLTIIRPVAGVEMDKNGPARIMALGFVLLMVGLFALASVGEMIGFLLASLACGIGMGIIMPTGITMVVNITEPTRRGIANSTFFSAVDVGLGLGTIALGLVAEFASVRMMYYVCSGLV